MQVIRSNDAACEIARHVKTLETGQNLASETRGFDEDRIQTYTLRSKESTPDYRFMPDPNLGPLLITQVTFTFPNITTRSWEYLGRG